MRNRFLKMTIIRMDRMVHIAAKNGTCMFCCFCFCMTYMTRSSFPTADMCPASESFSAVLAAKAPQQPHAVSGAGVRFENVGWFAMFANHSWLLCASNFGTVAFMQTLKPY